MTRRVALGGLVAAAMLRAAQTFALWRHDGIRERVSLRKQVQVVVFWSANCPRCLELLPRLEKAWQELARDGARLWIVDANANETLEDLNRVRGQWGLRTPLWKEDGELADHLGSTMTPEAFVVDVNGTVRYRGQFDDGAKADKARRRYVEEAVTMILAGNEPAVTRTTAFGCTLKRRK